MSADRFSRPRKKLTDAFGARSREKRRNRKDVVATAFAASAPRNDLHPELEIRDVPIELLKPLGRRTRRIDPAHVAELAESMRRWGVVDFPLVNADFSIVDGTIVVEAAKLLGLTHIRCAIASHLSPHGFRTLRLALNRLQEKGEWDLTELRIECEQLLELDEPLGIVGFSPQEIDLVLDQNDSGADKRADELPSVDPSSPAVSRLDDVWLLGVHQLLCGDATSASSYERLFESGRQARVIFTDPPYNIGINGFAVGAGARQHREFVSGSGEMDDAQFTTFLTSFLRCGAAHVTDGGLIYACMDWRHSEHLQLAARQAGLEQLNTIIWVKGHGGLGGMYRSAFEEILLFKKGSAPILNNIGLGTHGRDRSNVWQYPGANQRGSSANEQAANHPTPKPVELVADALLDSTSRGDIVLDPYAGSATTIIAAQQKQRIAYAIELDPLYVDLAIRRFEAFTGKKAVLKDGGKTFDEVADERCVVQPTNANN